MFWNEFKKLWKRPVIIAAFLFIIGYQFLQVWQGRNFLSEFDFNPEYCEIYQKYSGVMDKNWKRKIADEWKKYNANPNNHSKNFSVLNTAYAYCDFDMFLQQHIKSQQAQIAAIDSDYDLSRVEKAYEKLKNQSDKQIFDTKISMTIFIRNLSRMRDCIILFLILLTSTFFTSEEETGMDTILFTCKHGRIKLYWIKLIVCQISAIIVWGCVNISTVLAIRIMTGGIYGLDGIIQDFINNASPFVWDEKTYLYIISLMGIATACLISIFLFLIARKSRNSVTAIIVSLIIIFLPTIIKEYLPDFRLFFPNFLAGDFLWKNYSERRIRNFYIADWKLALLEIAVLLILMGICCLFFKDTTGNIEK